MRVAGIAGPGDPLANQQTFETFELIGKEFPDLMKCMSTNGLLLPESIDRLHALDLHSLTVTINAVKPETAAQIYRHIFYHGKRYSGKDAAEILLASQYEGVQRAVELGMVVKINTVLIPGINEAEIPLIAERIKGLGVFVMNVMPLIPQADLAHVPAPSQEYLAQVRNDNEKIIGQMRHCKQCRADAIGLL
jgi:nitrogen fixation protein NifB